MAFNATMTTPPTYYRTILPHGASFAIKPEQFASENLERKYRIQKSVIRQSSLHCFCLYCYQGFARMEDLYRHASDSGEGHSQILRENRNREPRGFYNFFREALNLTEAHIDDWTICHMRIPDLFDPAILMELLKNKKGYESAIALQEAIIMATSLRATCPICYRSFSLHATLKTHFRDHGSEEHTKLLAEPDGRFDTGRVITEVVNSAWNPTGNVFLIEPQMKSMFLCIPPRIVICNTIVSLGCSADSMGTVRIASTTIYDVITGETRVRTVR